MTEIEKALLTVVCKLVAEPNRFRQEVKAMYSPKIDELLIPALYQQAKAKGIPMTRLVNELLYKAIYNGGYFYADKDGDGIVGNIDCTR